MPRVNVVPAEIRGEIHHPAALVQALGGEVGTVAPDGLKVKIPGIAAESPLVGVAHRRLAVVWNQLGQGISPSPPSMLCPRRRPVTIPTDRGGRRRHFISAAAGPVQLYLV